MGRRHRQSGLLDNVLRLVAGHQSHDELTPQPPTNPDDNNDALTVLLPILIILSSLLFLILLFLICLLLLRRRRGIALRDSDGPTDMTREEAIDNQGGYDAAEAHWLESVEEETARTYRRAKEWQAQYPPNSQPTDITLSQFLSIQEKGVSAWSFDPDYEHMPSVLVHARTELTFLPDAGTTTSVQSNLPLPKLNEVYYWEVKLFDLPETTNVSIGLATKPYPSFQLPGQNRYSIAYHSTGDKSHNYPFTASSFGPPWKEGDVLGVAYRPRTGTVFFTRNGRKTEDAFVGLNKWNLFPTVGADGPCSLHVNLGQSGFVFIEANVKKWGLAPSVGTLAPPPAYGSERGSILLESGGVHRASRQGSVNAPPRTSSRRSRRSTGSQPPQPSPLRSNPPSPPPPITPIAEEPTDPRYISPTDAPFHQPARPDLPASPPSEEPQVESDSSGTTPISNPRRSEAGSPQRGHWRRASNGMSVQVHLEPDSPLNADPPTPNVLDIHLRNMSPSRASELLTVTEDTGTDSSQRGPNTVMTPTGARPPPAYSPLDPFAYEEGVMLDLPADVIASALETGTISPMPGSPSTGTGNRRSSRRESRRQR